MIDGGHIGMVFSDVDGTLVGADHHAIPQSASTIQKVAAHIPFCLVSARSPEGLYPIQRDLGFTGPLACYSGAYVLDEKGNELLSHVIPTTMALEVKHLVANLYPSITVGTYGFHNWLVDNRQDARVQHEEFLVQTTARECADLEGVFADKGVHKLLLMGDEADIALAEDELGARFATLNVVRSSAILCEIMAKEADKGSAVRLLCEHYGVDTTRALAFGDGPNDIDMLRAVGCSCAMANAEAVVKDVADAVLPWTNEECGVAKELERRMLA